MRSRATIEQAKGILVGRLGCPPEQAFRLLVAQSQHENRKLRDLAADLVTMNTRSAADGDGRRDVSPPSTPPPLDGGCCGPEGPAAGTGAANRPDRPRGLKR
jgi:hypothetical protein